MKMIYAKIISSFVEIAMLFNDTGPTEENV